MRRREIEIALVTRVCVRAWEKGRIPAIAALQMVTVCTTTWHASCASIVPCEGLCGQHLELAEAAAWRSDLTLDMAWEEGCRPTIATLHAFAVCVATWDGRGAGVVPCEGRRRVHIKIA